MRKRFFIKAFLFIVLVTGIQTLISPQAEIPLHTQYVDYIFSRKVDVVYFGDSSVTWAAADDPSKATIPQILGRFLPDVEIGDISHASFDMRMFAAYAQYFARMDYTPAWIIIPVNIRSFSPEWCMKTSSLAEEMKTVLALKGGPWMSFLKPVLVFKMKEEERSQFGYQHRKVRVGSRVIGRMQDFVGDDYKDFTTDKLVKKLMLRFMFTLTSDNPNMRALRETVAILKQRKTRVLFYMTPVDYQTGQRYLGEEFAEQLNKNIHAVISYLKQENMPVIDFSRALPTEIFSWHQDPSSLYTNEHLRLKGRVFVAQALAKIIRARMSVLPD